MLKLYFSLLLLVVEILLKFKAHGIAINTKSVTTESFKNNQNAIFSSGFKFFILSLNPNSGNAELKDMTLSVSANKTRLLDVSHRSPEIKISNASIHDFVDMGRNTSNEDEMLKMRSQTRVTGPVVAEPEVLVLFDYANFMLFNGDTTAMNDYLAIFYHAVNNRFATLQDPKVTVTISGVIAFDSRDSQTFLEQGLVSDGTGYDIGIVLEKLSLWVYAYKPFLPGFDIVSLISGETFKMKDGKGAYISGVAGLAYLAGACWTFGNRYLGVSVNADKGGFWNGVLTASHEIAHTLNSPHDGDFPGSRSCPWSQGYIMSYLGYGTKNKFYFSECSRNQIRSFIQSQSGSCVTTFQSSDSLILSQENPGDRLNMTAQCQKHLNRLDVQVETEGRSGQDLCLNLKCRVPYEGVGAVPGSYVIYTMNRVPGDGSVCGDNMICRDGDCVARS